MRYSRVIPVHATTRVAVYKSGPYLLEYSDPRGGWILWRARRKPLTVRVTPVTQPCRLDGRQWAEFSKVR